MRNADIPICDKSYSCTMPEPITLKGITRSAVELLRKSLEYLFPHTSEEDPGFRREVRRISKRSLYVIGAILVGTTIIAYPTVLTIIPVLPFEHYIGIPIFIAFLLVSVFPFYVARSRWGQRARAISLVIASVVAGASIALDMTLAQNFSDAEKFVLTDATGTLLVAVVLIPALPIQMFTLGTSIVLWFIAVFYMSHWHLETGAESLTTVAVVLGFDAILCAVLSAVNYQRLYASYRSHKEVMRTQFQLLLSENAATMGRLAAALSHELNNPLGALKSSISSLTSMRPRTDNLPQADHQFLHHLEIQLHETATAAVTRMEDIVGRMQRFANLDRAEIRTVDVADLISDVISLLFQDDLTDVDIQLELETSPPVVCRPQQISAVFSKLIQDAIDAVPRPGQIRVISAATDSILKVTIQDNRAPIPPNELASMFEPRFKIYAGHVTTGNWTLFNARQIIREHGGDMEVASESAGMRTVITLPSIRA